MSLNNNTDLSGCVMCKNCREIINISVEDSNTDCEDSSISSESKCLTWLQNCHISDADVLSDHTSTVSSTTVSTESSSTSDAQSGRIILSDSQMNVAGLEELKLVPSNRFDNVQVTHCPGAIVGSVTKIYGNVYITKHSSVVTQQAVTVLNKPQAVPRKLFILDRTSWLAQPPLEEKEYLEKPAKFVIICHTATEDGFTQSKNIYLVRQIQSYHIESRGWNDIGYNFLVGSDGNVYEGRGWRVVGAHTYGYNNISIGIAFVGCFMNKLPPEIALTQAKALIKTGVENGAIDKEYHLVSHCQCRPFESPGKNLHEEIKTWDNWYNLVNS